MNHPSKSQRVTVMPCLTVISVFRLVILILLCHLTSRKHGRSQDASVLSQADSRMFARKVSAILQ
jgi:hypothetical protein